MTSPTRTLKATLNDANPTSLASALQYIGFGDVIRALPLKRYKLVPVASLANMIASTNAIVLPDDAKCEKLLRAYARTGTSNLGELTVDAGAQTTTITAAHATRTESGDIAFLSTDAHLLVDVLYVPAKLDVYTLDLPVVAASGVCALPTWVTTKGVVTILEATITAATNKGVCPVVTPSDSVPTTTLQVNLNLAKTQVQFRIADAVTRATVKLGLIPATDLDTLLQADSPVV
jgi:hypothetical protein